MSNSKTLSEVLKDPKKVLFHSKAKINFTFSDIETIDDLPKTYHKIEKLHLSHNKITKLDGIQQFGAITHLSLSYNQIKDWEELLKIVNKDALVELNIKGNPLTAHPNHLYLIMDKFPNLQRIDDLKISKEDRYYLKNYWLLSGKLIPFFIQLKSDMAIVEQTLQRMKLTSEIRKRERDMTHKEKRENKEKLESLYYKMVEELKNESFFADIHRILGKYTKLQSQSPTLSLKVIDTVIQDLYENRLEHLVFERKDLYVNYRKQFNDLMLRYFSLHDTSLDRFLTQRVMDNSSYDHWKFAENNDYAFDCVLYEFYKLMPSQASISHNVNFTFNDNEQDRQNAWENARNKVITSLDVAPNNPDFLRNVCVTHFPLFPLNLQYNTMILKMMLSQLEIVENIAIDTYMLLDANSPIIKNLGNYRLFLESKMQSYRARSQTPPNRTGETVKTESTEGQRGRRRHTASLPASKKSGELRLGSPATLGGLTSSDRKSRKTDLFLIPKSNREENMNSTSKTRLPSLTDERLDSNPDQKGMSLKLDSGNAKYLDNKTSQTDRDFGYAGNKRNVLPLLIIVKVDTNEKMQLKEGFNRLKAFSKEQKKQQRKAIINEFYNNIREKMSNNLKWRIMKTWRQRTEKKGKLLECFREIRHRRLARYFYLFNAGCEKNRHEAKVYYMKNLSLKVFYSILNLRMKKRTSLKKILDKYSEKRQRIINLFLSKWRLMNSAMKYSIKKLGVSRTLSRLHTTRRGENLSDTRKYKDLKEEAQRLQAKKSMRELEPYFAKGRDIFRKCSACDYEI